MEMNVPRSLIIISIIFAAARGQIINFEDVLRNLGNLNTQAKVNTEQLDVLTQIVERYFLSFILEESVLRKNNLTSVYSTPESAVEHDSYNVSDQCLSDCETILNSTTVRDRYALQSKYDSIMCTPDRPMSTFIHYKSEFE